MSNATDTPCNAPHGNGVSVRRLQFQHNEGNDDREDSVREHLQPVLADLDPGPVHMNFYLTNTASLVQIQPPQP